jgi:hypothetical protein
MAFISVPTRKQQVLPYEHYRGRRVHDRGVQLHGQGWGHHAPHEVQYVTGEPRRDEGEGDAVGFAAANGKQKGQSSRDSCE